MPVHTVTDRQQQMRRRRARKRGGGGVALAASWIELCRRNGRVCDDVRSTVGGSGGDGAEEPDERVGGRGRPWPG